MTSYDDAATFRGQIQRGRGSAVRRAPGEPGAADAVYECVIGDSRWDWQVDQRDSYLAGLVRMLNLSLVPIEQYLAAFDADDAQEIDLALQVLAVLPFVGRNDAAEVLHRYVLEGKHWHAALDIIGAAGTAKLSGIWDALADNIVASRSEEAIQGVACYGSEPWMTWAKSRPEIQHILDEDRKSRGRSRTPGAEHRRQRQKVTEVGTEELNHRLAAGGPERRHALEELGRRGDHGILDLAEDPGMRNSAGWIPGMPQALSRLGPAAVPRARTWVMGGAPLAELGLRVLAEHGDPADVPVLLTALRRAISEEAWCFAEIPAQGLGRLRAADAADDLVSAWRTTAHSRARTDFLAALHECAPGRAESFAEEGLHDCESSVQQLACAIAVDSDSVRIRLVEITADPLLPEIHDAARDRLAMLVRDDRT